MTSAIKIHQVKTRHVNSYVIEYPHKLLVVDVAGGAHRYVLGFIEHELKRDVSEVGLVICSHDDPDHIGGVFSLAGLCNAPVGIPYASNLPFHKLINNPSGVLVKTATSFREALRARSWEMYINPKRDKDAKGKPVFAGLRADHQALNRHGIAKKYKKVDHRLKDKQTLPGFGDWSVIHTPGHSWDSCCFYHRQSQSLISGDTLLGSAKKGKLMTPSIYSNALHTQSSLNKLERLHLTAVYPGHGSIIEGDNLISNVHA
jgi:glyoxylase-like metal-dependent hydrolase (beta-lactamase superfamily II)